jgi:non-reducing end alpha-L-arabinofuranosidase
VNSNSGSNQRWTRTSSGELRVYSDSSPLCLDASGRGTANGTQAVIWSCNGQNNQQWQLG